MNCPGSLAPCLLLTLRWRYEVVIMEVLPVPWLVPQFGPSHKWKQGSVLWKWWLSTNAAEVTVKLRYSWWSISCMTHLSSLRGNLLTVAYISVQSLYVFWKKCFQNSPQRVSKEAKFCADFKNVQKSWVYQKGKFFLQKILFFRENFGKKCFSENKS
jgi:hypothetical protein